MALVIIDSFGASIEVLQVQDFSPTQFVCIGGLIEAVTNTDATLTGLGTSTSPLSVVFPPPDMSSFFVDADSGAAEEVSDGETLLVLGSTILTTAVSAPRTVTLAITPGIDSQILATVAGVPTWIAPPVGGSFEASADSGVNQVVSPGETINFLGSGLIASVASATRNITYELTPGLNGEVLSTVGGIPAWAAPVSDSLVDSGGTYGAGSKMLEHTAVDGTMFNFAEGFKTVQAAVGCVTPGVGAGKSVTSVSIGLANQLILAAAAEHNTVVGSASDADVLSTNIEGIGVYEDSILGPLNFNNPNSCREIRLLVNLNFGGQFVFTTTGVWDWEGRVSINGGAYVTTASSRFGTVPGTIGWPATMIGGETPVVAASGARSWSLRNRLTTVVAGTAGALWVSSSKAQYVLGSTN